MLCALLLLAFTPTASSTHKPNWECFPNGQETGTICAHASVHSGSALNSAAGVRGSSAGYGGWEDSEGVEDGCQGVAAWICSDTYTYTLRPTYWIKATACSAATVTVNGEVIIVVDPNDDCITAFDVI